MNAKKILLIVFSFVLALFIFSCFSNLSNNESANKPKTPQKQEPSSNVKCGIENCHGLEISCGPNIAEVCTEIYMAGDGCRQYANCSVIDGECQLVTRPEFALCKNCVENCQEQFAEDQENFFACESECINQTN